MKSISIILKNEISNLEKEAILQLWNQEYPQKLQYDSVFAFDLYLAGLTHKTHYLLIEKEKIAGWAMTFTRDSQRWFSILISSHMQGKGYGKEMLNQIKRKETHLLGWVIDHDNDRKANGEIYASPLEFYTKNEFVVQPDFRFDSEKLSAVRIEWKIPKA